MAKKGILIIIATGIISLSFIISTIPIVFISDKLSTYDTINEKLNFLYSPSLPSSIEKLYVNIDVGQLEINYVSPPVDYNVKIDVYIEMIGQNIPGKSYLDYFNYPVYQIIDSFAYFTFELISNDWFDPSMWFTKNVIIVVSIRKDIELDIIAKVNDGNVEITVPYKVSTKNLLINVMDGDIFYNFNYCRLEGNITGIVSMGNIFYNVNHSTVNGIINGVVQTGNMEVWIYNAKYSQNNSWDFTVDSGNFDIYINQYEDLGAIITGLAKINDGEAFVFYDDNGANIGANFEIPYGNHLLSLIDLPSCLMDTVYDLPCSSVNGFYYIQHTSSEGIAKLTSYDLWENRVKNYYNITFEIIQGSFNMDLFSIN